MQVIGATHVTPHMPQLGLRRRFVSHPSLDSPLQFPVPLTHVKPHRPAVHVADELGGGTQRLPHAAQWVVDVCRLASHPLVGSMSQSANPALHMNVHMPFVHVPAAFGAHVRPHMPQCARLERTSVSHPVAALPSQSPYDAMHV